MDNIHKIGDLVFLPYGGTARITKILKNGKCWIRGKHPVKKQYVTIKNLNLSEL